MDDRTVVITGASTGIGRACALYLDEQGYRVFAGVRKDADGDALAREASGRLEPLYIDVTEEDAISAAAQHVARATGGALLGLVNNAGIAVPGPLEHISVPDLRRQLEVNLVGQLAVTQALLPLLGKGRGRIVFVGSITGRWAVPFLGPYAISKAALEMMADVLRMELAAQHVSVSHLVCGSIATPIWEKGQATAENMVQGASRERLGSYETRARSARRFMDGIARAGIPPRAVARVVARALAAPRPRGRYIVGLDAWFLSLLASCAPAWFKDRSTLLGMSLRRGS